MYSVEPDAFDDTARSLAAGERLSNPADARSICDALLAPEPGVLTFPINNVLSAGGLSVSDDEVRAAMDYAFRILKLVVETGVRAVRLYEVWLGQDLRNVALLRVGLHDLNSEFDALDASGLLLNSAHAIGTGIAQIGENGPSIFPSTSLAARRQVTPAEGGWSARPCSTVCRTIRIGPSGQ